MSKLALRPLFSPLLGLLVSGVIVAQGLVTVAWAKDIEGVNRVQIEVEGVARGERLRVTKQALAELLVRLSGSKSVLADLRAQEIVSQADRFLLQYRYDTLSESEEQSADRNALVLHFDHNAVTDRLRSAGLPIWSLNRPSIAVWWVDQVQGERELIGAKSLSAIREALVVAAQRRGLSLLLPELDEQDLSVVTKADVWGFFTDRVLEASKRYDVGGVMLVKTQETGAEQRRVSWLVNLDGIESWGSSPSGRVGDVVSAAVDELADYMASQYAIIPSLDAQNSVRLLVDGVNSVATYSALQGYLAGLVPIEKVEVLQVNGDEIVFEFALLGDKSQLDRTLRLDGKLLKILASSSSGSRSTTFPAAIDSTGSAINGSDSAIGSAVLERYQWVQK